MRDRLKRVIRRSKYAATGAAIGAAVGAVFSRNAASTGGALGALAGVTIAEQRDSVDSVVDQIKERKEGEELVSDLE